MSRAIPVEAIDSLNEVKNDLSTIWLALGNPETGESDELILDIRESLHCVRQRLVAACKQIEGRNVGQ